MDSDKCMQDRLRAACGYPIGRFLANINKDLEYPKDNGEVKVVSIKLVVERSERTVDERTCINAIMSNAEWETKTRVRAAYVTKRTTEVRRTPTVGSTAQRQPQATQIMLKEQSNGESSCEKEEKTAKD